MIVYKTCTDVTLTQIYNTFRIGFSDYSIPFTAEEDEFHARFFGPEGNQLPYSFLAMEEEHPVGLLLGGIRMFDGLKTMRCGALCIAPDFRGRGISEELFRLHKNAALEAGCKQLLLEVIRDNHRAVRFYTKAGYLETVILKYYRKGIEDLSSPEKIPPYKITTITYDAVKSFRNKLKTCHINWQSDTPYYEDSKSEVFLGVYDDYQLIGLTAMSINGKINFLWVEPSYRLKGIGRYLLYQASMQAEAKTLTVCTPGNPVLEGFFRKSGFENDPAEQYEMYLPL